MTGRRAREAGVMRGGRYLVVLAGAGVLAAGCGTKMAPGVDLAAAVTRTAGQSARVAVTTTMQMPGMSVSFTETGVFDFARSRGMVSMQSPVGITVIFVPPKAYIKVPGGAGGPLSHGKAWIAVDAGMPGGPGAGGSLLGPPGTGTDPADLLASLTAISSSVTRLGTSAIRGVPVTGFGVDVDPAKAAARLPRWERASFVEFAQTLGRGAIPVDVWVDEQNLVRRVTLSLHLPGGAGAPAGARFVEATDFYDFGVPVRVSAPPAAQVASMPQLAKGGLSGPPGVGGPPGVSGTLSPAQAAAAEQVVSAFWSALGRNDPVAVAQMVPPAQRSCVRSLLNGGPKITVAALRLVSARPAGNGKATVRFTVRARASFGGQGIPLFAPGPGRVRWLVTTESAGHWYLDLARSADFMLGGACP
jgi:hypothetical protein